MSGIKFADALPVLKEDGRADMDDRELEKLERRFTRMASDRNQNAVKFALSINTSQIDAYKLASYIPSMIDEIRRLRACSK